MPQLEKILNHPPRRQPKSGIQSYAVVVDNKLQHLQHTHILKYHYRLDVELLGKDISWQKSDLRLDGDSSNDTLSQFLIDSSAALKEIFVSLQSPGTIKSFINHTDIMKAWIGLQPQLREAYTDAVFVQLLDQLEDHYYDHKKIPLLAERDLVWQLFFRAYLSDYLVYRGQSKETRLYYGIMGDLPIPLQCQASLGMQESDLLLQRQGQLFADSQQALQICHYWRQSQALETTDLQASLNETALLDFKTSWIRQATSHFSYSHPQYKNETTVTLKQQ
ncbi:MAG: hypothetical protein OIF50_01690 [Flavobacteriaceae bacterium]|nr:hypothetical protein [Flavobacteriaceae bacterium]